MLPCNSSYFNIYAFSLFFSFYFNVRQFVFDVVLIFILFFRFSFWIVIFQLYFIAHLFIYLINKKKCVFPRKEWRAWNIRKRKKNKISNIECQKKASEGKNCHIHKKQRVGHSQYVNVSVHGDFNAVYVKCCNETTELRRTIFKYCTT